MAEIWNDFQLRRPPLVTIPSSNAHSVSALCPLINKSLKRLHGWNFEFGYLAALLGRLIARRHNSFRHLLGFRTLRRLYSSLCRLKALDLPRDLATLRGALPDAIYVQDNAAAETPTVNTLDFVLLRLIAGYHLYDHIRGLCLKAAEFFSQQVSYNLFMETSILFLAVVSKLHAKLPSFMLECSRLYESLYRSRAHFPEQENYRFLPADFKLPEKLMNHTIVEQRSVAVDASPGPAETETTPLPTATGSANKPIVTMLAKSAHASKKRKLDLGVEVTREVPDSATQASTTTSTSNKKDNKFNVAQLSTVESVRKFIVEENKARKAALTSSLTHRIPQHEWLGAQKLFERKVTQKNAQKALDVFRKFVSSKL